MQVGPPALQPGPEHLGALGAAPRRGQGGGGGTGALTRRILSEVRKRFHAVRPDGPGVHGRHRRRSQVTHREAQQGGAHDDEHRHARRGVLEPPADAPSAPPGAAPGPSLVAGRDRCGRLGGHPRRRRAVGAGRRGPGPRDVVRRFFTSTGRLTGLVASALLLVQVILMARVPWVEQAWGQDELARTHRLVGFTSFTLLWPTSCSSPSGTPPPARWASGAPPVDFVVNYPGMLLGLRRHRSRSSWSSSPRSSGARRRLRYESWHLIHLYGYLGAGLALPHQLWTGAEFLHSTAATVFWWTLWARHGRRGPRLPGGRAAVALAPLAAAGRSRCAREGPGVTHRHRRRATACATSRCGPASSSSGASSTAPAGPAPTRTRSRRPPTAARCASRPPTSATAPPGSRPCGPARRVARRGPVRPDARRRARHGARCCSWGRASASRRCARCSRSCPRRPGDVTVVHRVRSAHEAVLADEMRSLAAARGARYLLVEGHRIRRPRELAAAPGRAPHRRPGAARDRARPRRPRRLRLRRRRLDDAPCAPPRSRPACRREPVHLERFSY